MVRRLEMLLAASLQKERRWKCCWRRGYRRSVAGNTVGGAVLKSPAAGRLLMDAREQITAAFRTLHCPPNAGDVIRRLIEHIALGNRLGYHCRQVVRIDKGKGLYRISHCA